MKKVLAFSGIVWLLSFQSFAGALPEDPRVFPALIAHDKGTGSGCFLQLSNSVYLVTAKHVLFSKTEGTNPPALLSPAIVVKSYSHFGTSNVSERAMVMNLAQLLSTGDVRCSTNRDVALVRIQDCNTNDPNIVSPLPGFAYISVARGLNLNNRDFACVLKDVDVGAEVYMFGYPTSLTGPIAEIFDPSEPLLRKGIVAGVNLGRRTIIIDCPSYFGNSGGPVIQVDRSDITVTRYRVIGLVSGFVPFQEEWENKTLQYSHVLKSNSGYTVVEPIDIALELVWK
jgi:Trypsin-like peptidase domain